MLTVNRTLSHCSVGESISQSGRGFFGVSEMLLCGSETYLTDDSLARQ